MVINDKLETHQLKRKIMSKVYSASESASAAKRKLTKAIAKQIMLACKSRNAEDLTPIFSALSTHDDIETISLFRALAERFEKKSVRLENTSASSSGCLKINAHQDAVNDLDGVFLTMFEDFSWHNDSMPIFRLPFQDEGGKSRCLVLHVDYKDIEEREMGNGNRFHLFHSDIAENDEYDIDDEGALILATNDFEAIKNKVYEWVPSSK